MATNKEIEKEYLKWARFLYKQYKKEKAKDNREKAKKDTQWYSIKIPVVSLGYFI